MFPRKSVAGFHAAAIQAARHARFLLRLADVVWRRSVTRVAQSCRDLCKEPIITFALTSGTGVNLLWTGGWDSTFQLLRLLLIHGRPVTPFYLMDPTRPSAQIGLKTMQRIRDCLVEACPQTDRQD